MDNLIIVGKKSFKNNDWRILFKRQIFMGKFINELIRLDL